MADSNRVRLSYGLEATYGTASPATYFDLRATGESLKADTGTVSSQELRSDRNIPDVARVGLSATGDLNIELSCQSFDNLFLWALGKGSLTAVQNFGGIQGTWASTGPYTGTFTSSAAGFFATLQPFPNRWARVVQDNATGNTGWWKVTGIDAPGTVLTVLGTKAVVAGVSAVGGTVIRCGETCVNGVDLFSFTLDKQYQDLTTEWERVTGCVTDRFNISVSSDQIVTGSFGVLGKTAISAAASAGAGYSVAPTNSILTGVANVYGVLENIAPLTITAISIQAQNNLRSRQVVGTLGSFSVGQGSMVVTGTLTAYFNTSGSDVMDKYLNNTSSSIAIVFAEQPTSAASGSYTIFDMPNVEFTTGQVLSTGMNGDVMVELGFQALLYANPLGSTEGPYSIRFTRG